MYPINGMDQLHSLAVAVPVRHAGDSSPRSDSHRRKGLWTEEEDQLLMEAVLKLSASQWTQVSKLVPGRTAKSCRLRWCNQLCPGINKAPFTEWETAVIAVGQKSLGWRWADLARLLHQRTDNAVKNHWKSIVARNKIRSIWKENRFLSSKADIGLEDLLRIDAKQAGAYSSHHRHSSPTATSQDLGSQLDVFTAGQTVDHDAHTGSESDYSVRCPHGGMLAAPPCQHMPVMTTTSVVSTASAENTATLRTPSGEYLGGPIASGNAPNAVSPLDKSFSSPVQQQQQQQQQQGTSLLPKLQSVASAQLRQHYDQQRPATPSIMPQASGNFPQEQAQQQQQQQQYPSSDYNHVFFEDMLQPYPVSFSAFSDSFTSTDTALSLGLDSSGPPNNASCSGNYSSSLPLPQCDLPGLCKQWEESGMEEAFAMFLGPAM